MWNVYIAKSKTNRYYTGMTTNTGERLKRHNSGEGSRFAVQYGSLEIVYESPKFSSKSEARRREIQIKGWSRAKKELLIFGIFK